MLDDFFVRALIAAVGIAITAGPLGCFIVWRRMAYFGDTLAHAALLGVALSLLTEIDMKLSVFAVAVLISLALLSMQRRDTLPADALLGLLSHTALATGLVALALMSWIRVDVMGLLFGDILAVSKTDLLVVYSGGAVVLGALAWIWKPLLATTVSAELARAENQHPNRVNLVFMLLLAIVIALAIQIIGALLITALLIIPAATARRLTSGPETMAVTAASLGVVAGIGGLLGSLTWDTPSGPSIVLAAAIIFALTSLPWGRLSGAGKEKER